jgi:hypothetical protein
MIDFESLFFKKKKLIQILKNENRKYFYEVDMI